MFNPFLLSTCVAFAESLLLVWLQRLLAAVVRNADKRLTKTLVRPTSSPMSLFSYVTSSETSESFVKNRYVTVFLCYEILKLVEYLVVDEIMSRTRR